MPRKTIAPRLLAGILTAASLAALAVTQVGAVPPKTSKISGRILGASNSNAIYVALWHSDGFLKSPVRQIRIEPGADRTYKFEVPAGRWAVSAFEDRNGNGVLDMGMFGPKEPSGF